MALSQDQTTQAHVSVKIFENIDSDSVRIVFYSIYCQTRKYTWQKNYKGDGVMSKWT